MKRAMYFESDRSDPDGYMAVGTVVMNRLTSGAYPETICGVVSQEKQFAPGVMTREIKPEAEPALNSAADAILHGKRHPGIKNAMFFHTKGLSFPYDNMHYVAVAGGNAFYEKRDPANGLLETPPPLPAFEVAMNYVPNGGVQPVSFDASRFGQQVAYSPAPQASAAIAQNLDAVPGVAPAAPTSSAAFANVPASSAAFANAQTSTSAPRAADFDVAQPASVPLPTPMPGEVRDSAPSAASAPNYTVPTAIVRPTPRPSLDSAALRGRGTQMGG